MNEAYLGLGSNLGDRKGNLQGAIELISNHPEINILKLSSIYETKPFGYTEQPNFLNMVIAISTTLEPKELLTALLNIENELGRKRDLHWGPRTIDIDILLYENRVIDLEDLQIPHPYLTERLFVLIPLSEIYNGSIPNNSLNLTKMIERLDGERGDVIKWRE